MNVTKKHFIDFIKKIVEIATLQTSYVTIDECLKITNRRVNALEYIVCPRIEYVINYIFTELEEREKEDKFKIKKVLLNKAKAKENDEKTKSEFAGSKVQALPEGDGHGVDDGHAHEDDLEGGEMFADEDAQEENDILFK